LDHLKNKLRRKTDLYNFCRSNGFLLSEYPLEGRLLAVLFKPKVIIKQTLDEERKRSLVKKAISYLLTSPDCQLVIFWDGEKQFFRL